MDTLSEEIRDIEQAVERVSEEPLDVAGKSAHAATEPLREVNRDIEKVVTEGLRNLSEAVKLNTNTLARHSEALQSIERSLRETLDRALALTEKTAETAVETAADAIEAASNVPEAAVDTVQMAVEEVAEPPARLKRRSRFIGKRR